MKRSFLAVVVTAALAMVTFATDETKEEKRLENSAKVLEEILNVPDDVPQDLLRKTECVM